MPAGIERDGRHRLEHGLGPPVFEDAAIAREGAAWRRPRATKMNSGCPNGAAASRRAEAGINTLKQDKKCVSAMSGIQQLIIDERNSDIVIIANIDNVFLFCILLTLLTMKIFKICYKNVVKTIKLPYFAFKILYFKIVSFVAKVLHLYYP